MTGNNDPLTDRQALALLNDWQHRFPLEEKPFETIAQRLETSEIAVLRALRACRVSGKLSRIGAVWSRGAGGAAALCALAVPIERLPAVADAVNREPLVNHNYEREHDWNLWYVLTGSDEAQVQATAQRIARQAEVPSLYLPMVRAYRVDLGFDLRAPAATVHAGRACERSVTPVAPDERPLAALAEQGLPLVPRPFHVWAAHLNWPVERVLQTLRQWRAGGTVRRFGVVVRHHDLGFAANAMTVVQVPEHAVDDIGAVIGLQPGVTLAYQRVPDGRWPYNLYFMVHGRERVRVRALVKQALANAGALSLPHATLFSLRRFKQTGGRYFSTPVASEAEETAA